MNKKDKFTLKGLSPTEPKISGKSKPRDEELFPSNKREVEKETENLNQQKESPKNYPRNVGNQIESGEPRESFSQSKKKQLGFRVREEFLEAIKLEAKSTDASGEIVLDRILINYYQSNADKLQFIDTARQLIKLSNKVL